MRISDLIKNETQTIKWIKDEFEKGNLFVDNSFQRRYVWLKKHQVCLIETILMGYVIPEIYIWEVDTDAETGDTKYSIVDGQQRIGAIVSYINDDFNLSEKYLSDKKSSYAGKKFSELSSEEKRNIWSYSLSFRRIVNSVNKDDIKKIFLRLNLTDKSLNPQELRNAEYDGLFLQNAISIANLDFWSKYNIFNSDDLRRMGDVEFISSILIFLRKGIESEISQEAINEVYDLYNEEYEQANEDKKIVMNILSCLECIVNKDVTGKILSYIKKKTHLYTMIVVIYKHIGKDMLLDTCQLNRFIDFYAKYEYSKTDFADEYRALFQGGTRSKQNRIRRVRMLSDVIDGKVIVT